MKVKELAELIDAQLHLGTCSEDSEVSRVHASDTMSDLIEHAAADTLLLTTLNNNQLIRVAELMDVPGHLPGVRSGSPARAPGARARGRNGDPGLTGRPGRDLPAPGIPFRQPEGDQDMITLSYRIQGGDFDSAGLATRKLKEQLAKIGVGACVMRRAMIASYEAEMNVVIHARTGTLWARLDEVKLDLEVADEGPGNSRRAACPAGRLVHGLLAGPADGFRRRAGPAEYPKEQRSFRYRDTGGQGNQDSVHHTARRAG